MRARQPESRGSTGEGTGVYPGPRYELSTTIQETGTYLDDEALEEEISRCK
jgi:hypothetical protein